jgi:hypothetical protein
MNFNAAAIDQRHEQSRHQYFHRFLDACLDSAPDNENNDQVDDRVPEQQTPRIAHQSAEHGIRLPGVQSFECTACRAYEVIESPAR